MSKLIIIDGMDNTGKSTLINRLLNVLTTLNCKVCVLHLTKPPKNILSSETSQYQHNYYMSMIDLLKVLKTLYDFIIMDRGWLSEYVYGPMYRNRDKKDIIEDNIVIEQKLIYLFGLENIYMFLCLASTSFLIKNDDGNSLSDKNFDSITKECHTFEECFSYSIIKKKYELTVDTNNNYRELLPFIYKKICNYE